MNDLDTLHYVFLISWSIWATCMWWLCGKVRSGKYRDIIILERRESDIQNQLKSERENNHGTQA